MPFPRYPEKHALKALINPPDYMDYLRSRDAVPSIDPPHGAIICYQHSLWRHIQEMPGTRQPDGFLSGGRLLDRDGRTILCVKCQGVGAPIAAAQIEELIAFGITRFVSVGTAGAIQHGLEIGDIVVCDSAVRDEGTSHHYLPLDHEARPSPDMLAGLIDRLTREEINHHVGAAWTTDAPYRETIDEIKHYQQQGVAVVEMEAAALLCVAAYRGAALGAMFTVSDTLADLSWSPAFHHADTKDGLKKLLEVAIDTLAC
ncbi:MAG: nucleoside phosphorylase [Planctomycetota bacterium]